MHAHTSRKRMKKHMAKMWTFEKSRWRIRMHGVCNFSISLKLFKKIFKKREPKVMAPTRECWARSPETCVLSQQHARLSHRTLQECVACYLKAVLAAGLWSHLPLYLLPSPLPTPGPGDCYRASALKATLHFLQKVFIYRYGHPEPHGSPNCYFRDKENRDSVRLQVSI